MAKEKGSKFASKLKKMQGGWDESAEQYDKVFGARDLPEDTFLFKLQEACLAEKDDKVSVKREHVVIEGEHKGVVVPDSFSLDSEWGRIFARRWIKMMDKDVPKKLADLPALLKEIKEDAPIVKGKVTHSGGFTNVDVISVIEDDGDREEGGSAGEDGTVDLDDMDKKELRKYVKENDLDIDGYRKMDEEDLRDAIVKAEKGSSEDEGKESGEGAPDFDEMDKEDLLEYIDENEIEPSDLGFKTAKKMKKADEDALREALEDYTEDEQGEEEGEEEGGSEDDDKLLEGAKEFCGTWNVKIAKDADLDDIKEAIADCEFPADECDEDEVELLTELGLDGTIKAKKKKGKK